MQLERWQWQWAQHQQWDDDDNEIDGGDDDGDSDGERYDQEPRTHDGGLRGEKCVENQPIVKIF